MGERVELNPGLMALYLAIRAKKTPGDIERELGLHRQAQANLRAELTKRGVLTRVGTVHKNASRTKEYPWRLTGVIPALPRYPKGATFRDVYPVERAGVEVEPVTVVRWGPWSVQGVPVPRHDGRPVRVVTPDCRVVRVGNLATGRRDVFEAPLRERWTQADTIARVSGPLTPVESRELTIIIAAVIGERGVEAILDLDNLMESP